MSSHEGSSPRRRPNVDLIASVYEAFKQRDIEQALGFIAPGATIYQSSEVPWGGAYSGQEGVLQFFMNLSGAISSTVAVERFVDAGDHVVAIARTQGTVNATGRPFDVPVAHVWKIVDGKVASVEFYIDNPTMRASLGEP